MSSPEVTVQPMITPKSVGQTPGLQKAASRRIYLEAFTGLFLRDLRVLSRELAPFVLRVVMQPLLFLFVFTYVFPHMNTTNPMATGAGPSFATILMPGLMAVAIMFSGIAGVALPLASEFGVTRGRSMTG